MHLEPEVPVFLENIILWCYGSPYLQNATEYIPVPEELKSQDET